MSHQSDMVLIIFPMSVSAGGSREGNTAYLFSKVEHPIPEGAYHAEKELDTAAWNTPEAFELRAMSVQDAKNARDAKQQYLAQCRIWHKEGRPHPFPDCIRSEDSSMVNTPMASADCSVVPSPDSSGMASPVSEEEEEAGVEDGSSPDSGAMPFTMSTPGVSPLPFPSELSHTLSGLWLEVIPGTPSVSGSDDAELMAEQALGVMAVQQAGEVLVAGPGGELMAVLGEVAVAMAGLALHTHMHVPEVQPKAGLGLDGALLGGSGGDVLMAEVAEQVARHGGVQGASVEALLVAVAGVLGAGAVQGSERRPFRAPISTAAFPWVDLHRVIKKGRGRGL